LGKRFLVLFMSGEDIEVEKQMQNNVPKAAL